MMMSNRVQFANFSDVLCAGIQHFDELSHKRPLSEVEPNGELEGLIRCTLQKVARTGVSVGVDGPTFTSWLTDLDDTLYLRVIDARKKAGLDATISQDEYDALCMIDSRMIREARASWPNGRERVEMNGHHVLLWPLENGWWLADAPDFPDSWLQGETRQEALELIQDAMAYAGGS